MRKTDLPGSAELRRLYVDEGLSCQAIGEQFGCQATTVGKRLRKHGIPRRRTGPLSGDQHPQWRGGVTISNGYVMRYAPNHPHARRVHKSGGYVQEHRLVMEEHLGRLLLPGEVVHHKDSDRANNAIDNLELYSENSEHLKHELTGKCPRWTEAGKRRIQDGIRRSAERRRIEMPPIDDVRAWYVTHKMSLEAIGKKIGCSHDVVGNYLRQHGVTIRGCAHPKHDIPEPDVLRELYESKTPNEICEQLGFGLGVLYHWLKKYKIPLRHRRRESKPNTRPRSTRGAQAS